MFKFTAVAASLAVLASASAISVPAMAAEKPTNPWIECGIGAMIFPHTPVGAVISNVIWDYGITATTSMMSSPEMCEGTRAKVAMFINTNYNELAAQTAVGQGEHLAAMAQVINCDAAGRALLATRVRAEMPALVAQPGFDALPQNKKAEAYFNIVDKVAATELSSSCKLS